MKREKKLSKGEDRRWGEWTQRQRGCGSGEDPEGVMEISEGEPTAGQKSSGAAAVE